jgi:hypothetical protein
MHLISETLQTLTMLFCQTVTLSGLFAFLAMASPSPNTQGPDLRQVSEPRAVAVHNIMMWTNDTKAKTMAKFLNVPIDYRIEDIKHADHVGMFWVFNNGETWLTLEGKHLFLVAPADRDPRGPEVPEDFPIMPPDELQRVLASGEFPSYEEVAAKWAAVEASTRSAKRDVAEGASKYHDP